MQCPILSVPASIRQRIYTHLPLTGQFLQLGCKAESKRQVQNVTRLMQLCKTLYDEIAAIFFSQNTFLIRVVKHDDLRFLLNQRASNLKHMTSLFLDFNEPSKPTRTRHRAAGSVRPGSRSRPRRRLGPLLQAWRDTWSFLLERIEASVFTLAFACDVPDLDTAKQFMQPLLTYEGTIAGCSIKLGTGHNRDYPLQDLAEKTVTQITGKQRDHRRFAFGKLPREIQFSVLRYTSLITPFKEANWNPREGYFIWYSDDPVCAEHRYPSYEYPSQALEVLSKRPSSCFCRRYYDAFSSSLPQCDCWCPPTALFLVNKTFRNRAECIFFSENRMIVLPVDGSYVRPPDNPSRFEASLFFATLRRTALASLRTLEIVFPPFRTGYCPASGAALSDWTDTLTRARDQLTLSNLSIRIHMANDLRSDYVADGHYNEELEMTQWEGQEKIEAYRRILEPFSQYRQLRHFYLYLAWPWEWNALREDISNYRDTIESPRQELEWQLLQEVMGDQSARLDHGKADWRGSQWFEWTRTVDYLD